MNLVRKFLALQPEDRWLLADAFRVVATVRLRLALLPFRPGTACARSARQRWCAPDRVAWAVDRAAGVLGNAACLARALAGHSMLARRGFASRISIGVTAGEAQQNSSSLIAHAWLEAGGRILLGGPDVGRYSPLFTWGNS